MTIYIIIIYLFYTEKSLFYRKILHQAAIAALNFYAARVLHILTLTSKQVTAPLREVRYV